MEVGVLRTHHRGGVMTPWRPYVLLRNSPNTPTRTLRRWKPGTTAGAARENNKNNTNSPVEYEGEGEGEALSFEVPTVTVRSTSRTSVWRQINDDDEEEERDVRTGEGDLQARRHGVRRRRRKRSGERPRDGSEVEEVEEVESVSPPAPAPAPIAASHPLGARLALFVAVAVATAALATRGFKPGGDRSGGNGKGNAKSPLSIDTGEVVERQASGGGDRPTVPADEPKAPSSSSSSAADADRLRRELDAARDLHEAQTSEASEQLAYAREELVGARRESERLRGELADAKRRLAEREREVVRLEARVMEGEREGEGRSAAPWAEGVAAEVRREQEEAILARERDSGAALAELRRATDLAFEAARAAASPREGGEVAERGGEASLDDRAASFGTDLSRDLLRAELDHLEGVNGALHALLETTQDRHAKQATEFYFKTLELKCELARLQFEAGQTLGEGRQAQAPSSS
ncbi:hypothetical protein HKI87_04g27150 [Chloropicon roscoffensis]|uniref:Uncharacterized protein n=2 Tax=Chloropicon roscoffensis TaxID=1461544 RepID=A0AAX4P527_9CHLO